MKAIAIILAMLALAFLAKKAIIKKILKIRYYKKCNVKSREILKRGSEAYNEYTTKFIFESLTKATFKTPILSLKKIKVLKIKIPIPVMPIVYAPNIYFTQVINPLIAKFPIKNTQFDKLGRNDRIIVREKFSGASITLKKKNYNPNKHNFIKIA